MNKKLAEKLHEYEDVINMELYYHKTASQILHQFYYKDEEDFQLTEKERQVLKVLIENQKNDK
ncbi:MAG: aminotransferase [Floccifex sp.]